MNLLQISAEQPQLQPETIFSVFGWPISNTILMTWLVAILFLICGHFIRQRIKQNKQLTPNTFQNIVEIIYESMYNLLNQVTGNEKYTKKIFPLIGTLFVFIGVSNLIGLIPVLTSFTFNGDPILRTPTNDFNMTFGLAVSMVILTQIISIRDWGLFSHLGKYIKLKEIILGFKKSIKDGVMSLIDFFIGLLDLISEIAKIISLSLRLFGNMYAGEVLAVIILGGLAIALPSVWLAMNLIVALVQTIVFGSLTAAYYMMSIKPEEIPEEA